MIARFAREYEGRVTFMTSPGLDDQSAMADAVNDFGWPSSMIHAVDEDGRLSPRPDCGAFLCEGEKRRELMLSRARS
jgi:hypothetical protein